MPLRVTYGLANQHLPGACQKCRISIPTSQTCWIQPAHSTGSQVIPGEGNGNPLQCSCLENPRDGAAWWAAVYGVAQSRTLLKRLSSSSRKCFLYSQPNPCLLWHKLFLFCLQQRQKNSSTSLCFHLKTVTKLPF